MLKSSTLCQYSKQQSLEIIHKQLCQSIIYHSMNDILLADSDSYTLEKMFEEIKIIFPYYELLKFITT